MLDQARFAFLVMTAEDEQADGNHHARMNVIHEVGLFQGRLGFERAFFFNTERPIAKRYHLSNRTIIIWCFYF
jgi:predicted nucleotide-binding protein